MVHGKQIIYVFIMCNEQNGFKSNGSSQTLHSMSSEYMLFKVFLDFQVFAQSLQNRGTFIEVQFPLMYNFRLDSKLNISSHNLHSTFLVFQNK